MISEEKSTEILADGRRTEFGCIICSPGASGSGELIFFVCLKQFQILCNAERNIRISNLRNSLGNDLAALQSLG